MKVKRTTMAKTIRIYRIESDGPALGCWSLPGEFGSRPRRSLATLPEDRATGADRGVKNRQGSRKGWQIAPCQG
jgi:hypothetical protein